MFIATWTLYARGRITAQGETTPTLALSTLDDVKVQVNKTIDRLKDDDLLARDFCLEVKVRRS
jgi:hypothetical protein